MHFLLVYSYLVCLLVFSLCARPSDCIAWRIRFETALPGPGTISVTDLPPVRNALSPEPSAFESPPSFFSLLVTCFSALRQHFFFLLIHIFRYSCAHRCFAFHCFRNPHVRFTVVLNGSPDLEWCTTGGRYGRIPKIITPRETVAPSRTRHLAQDCYVSDCGKPFSPKNRLPSTSWPGCTSAWRLISRQSPSPSVEPRS